MFIHEMTTEECTEALERARRWTSCLRARESTLCCSYQLCL